MLNPFFKESEFQLFNDNNLDDHIYSFRKALKPFNLIIEEVLHTEKDLEEKGLTNVNVEELDICSPKYVIKFKGFNTAYNTKIEDNPIVTYPHPPMST